VCLNSMIPLHIAHANQEKTPNWREMYSAKSALGVHSRTSGDGLVQRRTNGIAAVLVGDIPQAFFTLILVCRHTFPCI